ncbi:MAG TPA: hypothetical protein DDW30_04415 [Clostridiales bacterium]|nr:hypothetical protein [Clostridiales bacterium]
MLIGSTYAWFTDTATTAVNTIQAGTLDVALEMSTDNGTTWEDAEGKTLQFLVDGQLPAKGTQILWEPGCTYNLPLLRVVNKGKLSLKYEIVITGIDGDAELNKAIEWTIPAEKTGNLAAGATSADIAISGHMKETAGNEYQGLRIDGIAITVYATQYTGESDSNGNTYDENAPIVYPEGVTADSFAKATTVKYSKTWGGFSIGVATSEEDLAAHPAVLAYVKDGEMVYAADLRVAMADGATTIYCKEKAVILTVGSHVDVTKDLTIYANGAEFYTETTKLAGGDLAIGFNAAPEKAETTINIYNAKNLVVWGNPTEREDVWNVNFYDCVNEGSNFLMYRGNEDKVGKVNLTMTNCRATGYIDSTVHTTADGSITIKNCLFISNCAPINIAHKQSGTMTVTVENSTFSACGKVNPADDYFAPARFVNNSATGTLNVTLKNNVFEGTIGTNGDILLGDYRKGKASNPFTATIVTDETVMVKSSIGPAHSYNGGTVEVVPQSVVDDAIKNAASGANIKLASNGTYTIPAITNKQLTISGGKNTVIDMTKSDIIDAQNTGLDITFDGVTVQFANDDYKGIKHSKKVVYQNCTLLGKQFLYAEEVEFINCKFVQDVVDYNIWTYGAGKVLFKDCEFDCQGKSVLIYNEGTLTAQTVEFQNCKFNASAPANGKAAIEVDCRFTSYEVIIDQATADNVNGFATGSKSGSTVWNVKDGSKTTTVTVAGAKVFEQ